MSNDSAVPSTPKPRSPKLDAWYDDEFAPGAPKNLHTGCRLNKFNRPPNFDKLGPGTAVLVSGNPLEDRTKTRVVEVGKGNKDFGGKHQYWCFASNAVRRASPAVVKLSLLFGSPGPVMCRHGLRHYFEGLADRVLIVTEGTEEDPKFGFGITLDMIDTLVNLAIGRPKGTVKAQLDVLAGYSTGFHGMNSTILNIFNDPELKTVRKMIYYDCLYRHDAPAPGRNTLRAMQRMVSLNSSLKILIYELTGNITDDPRGPFVGGTPTKTNGRFWTDFPTSPDADPFSKGNTITTVNKIKGAPFAAFFTLALARLIDNAIKTGYFDEVYVRKKFSAGGDALMNAIKSDLKPRGSYASSVSATPSGKTWFGQWTSASNIAAIAAVADKVRVDRVANPLFSLLGWPVPGLGDMSHDSHLQEFAWEHLTG
jgi:hypothetical protein